MTREEFKLKLLENAIDPNLVSFDDNFKEGYNVKKIDIGWEVFIRERGQEYDAVVYPSESSALESLFTELKRLYSKKII